MTRGEVHRGWAAAKKRHAGEDHETDRDPSYGHDDTQARGLAHLAPFHRTTAVGSLPPDTLTRLPQRLLIKPLFSNVKALGGFVKDTRSSQ
jgi:hypothetical protein